MELKRTRLENGLECLTPVRPRAYGPATLAEWLEVMAAAAALLAVLATLQQIIPV